MDLLTALVFVLIAAGMSQSASVAPVGLVLLGCGLFACSVIVFEWLAGVEHHD